MTKRIFRSILLVTSVVLLAGLVVVMVVFYENLTDIQMQMLRSQAELAAHAVENEGVSYLDSLDAEGKYRITLVGSDGDVRYDSRADESIMENHSDREEIMEARRTGFGEGARMSHTLSERTFYCAMLLDDGSVIRVSVTSDTVLVLLSGLIQPILLVLILALALSGVLASRLSRRIVDPLNDLDLDSPLENDAYEEVAPLLSRIEQQHRQIERQMERLRRQQDEFLTVTDNMNEGLVTLSRKGEILSINRAAMKLFGTDESCIGSDILTVDRSGAMQRLISEALDGRVASEVRGVMQHDGQSDAQTQYRLDASPVISGGSVEGVCLVAFDVTERQRAERLRREFSANVSHELKTPLHSIMGAAEIIENGLVRPEDIPDFAGRIRGEGSRLLSLIDDIIHLSELDEGGDLEAEDVDLSSLAENILSTLEFEAAKRDITLTLHGGGEVKIKAVRRLAEEIVYNLCDNAVKYNRDGGSVDVTVTSSEGGGAVVTVADTGIGIPAEAQQRVFERFYRVDKSHSKATGGTGLGLSIVKHAASYLGAKVTLHSTLGEGTEVTVTFA